jgi:hypothetical protein
VKLVQLKRQIGDGIAEVVAAVGPMEDAEADDYAARLLHLVEQHAERGFSVGTTPVASTSGAAAESPAGPAELLRAVLARAQGTGEGAHDVPESEART